MLSVTKIFEFAYAHNLPGYEGKCKNLHGHTGVLEVEVSGSPIGYFVYDGMIVDFGDLKNIVNEKIIAKFDHVYINDFISVPTAEKMTMEIVIMLQEIFQGHLLRVRVYETPTSYAEWRKE